MKILIVDDDENARVCLERALKTRGYQVECSTNGIQALETVRHSPPDMIISDIMMPEMDGFMFCRKVKEDERLKEIPFVFYTATFIDESDEKLAYKLGASRFIVKPMEFPDFFKIITDEIEKYIGHKLPATERPASEACILDQMYLRSLTQKLQTKVQDLEKTRKLLEASEQQYRTVADFTYDWEYWQAPDETIKYVSPSCERITGFSIKEFLQDSNLISRLVHPDDQELFANHIVACRTTTDKDDLREMDFRIITKSGEERWLAHYCRRVYNSSGAYLGRRISNSDITERKRGEQLLQESEAIQRTLLEKIPVGVVVIDPVTRMIENVNLTASTLFGAQPKDIVGHRCHSFLCPAGENACPIIDLGKVVDNSEREMLCADGSRRPVLKSVTRISIQGQEKLLECFVDLTERKALETQLQQAQKMESVGRLAGGVAHDFNNMLVVISGRAEVALNKTAPGQSIYSDLEEILKAAKRSADLTRQLLSFARKQTISPKVLDLNDTVAGMLKMLQRLVGENIYFVWQPKAGLWPLKADPSQIDQILANLCVNARDAITDVGKIIIETENIVFDESYCANHADCVTGEYVLLSVSDNGCGMDKETLSHLFEPFFTTKSIGKGTGLGLASVYGAVKQNNGFINVSSEPGQGTTFKIYLPRHLSEAINTQAEGALKPSIRGHETILIVDDESSILDTASVMLENQGYTVLASSTPDEAIRMAKEHSGGIHLLMADVIMPEMNGRDLAKYLMSINPQLKCLYFSGYSADVIAHHGVLDEGVQFLQKPFTLNSLAAKVREVLDSK